MSDKKNNEMQPVENVGLDAADVDEVRGHLFGGAMQELSDEQLDSVAGGGRDISRWDVSKVTSMSSMF